MESVGPWLGGLGALLGLVTGTCVALLPLVIFAWIGWFLFRRHQRTEELRARAVAWPGVEGVVLHSTIHVNRTGNSRTEVPMVVYEYRVGDTTYRNDQIRLGDRFGRIIRSGDARSALLRYVPGTPVTVYYNPADPQEAALER